MNVYPNTNKKLLTNRLSSESGFVVATSIMSFNLSLQEKILLSVINFINRREEEFFYTNKQIGDFFSLSPSRVSSILSTLKDGGFIEVDNSKYIGPYQMRVIKCTHSF